MYVLYVCLFLYHLIVVSLFLSSAFIGNFCVVFLLPLSASLSPFLSLFTLSLFPIDNVHIYKLL